MVTLASVALGLVVALVGGWVGLRRARREWGIRRELKGAEGVRTGALRPGVVELEGDARPAAETFTSPLTGQECVAYQYEVEERQRTHSDSDSGSSHEWRTVVDHERAAPFHVDDGSGPAMVDAPAAEFRLERAYECSSEDASTGAVGKVIATLTGGETGPDLPIREDRLEEMRAASSRRRYCERLVLPGESVYVYGEAMPTEEVVAGDEGAGGALAATAGTMESGRHAGVFGGIISTLSGGSGEYRRAKRTDPGEGMAAAAPSETDVEEMQERVERMRRLSEELDDDPGEMTAEQRRRMMEIAGDSPMDLATGGPVEAFTEGMSDLVHGDDRGTTGDAERDPFAGEELVVSRGDTIGEFVLSDGEKGEVIRSYSTTTLKWLFVALGSLAVGAGLVALGLLSGGSPPGELGIGSTVERVVGLAGSLLPAGSAGSSLPAWLAPTAVDPAATDPGTGAESLATRYGGALEMTTHTTAITTDERRSERRTGPRPVPAAGRSTGAATGPTGGS